MAAVAPFSKANAFSSASASGATAGAAPTESVDGPKGDLYTFTIGKVDAGMAILIGERASLIEFPSILLPHGVTSGSVVNIRVHRNEAEEQRQRAEFEQLQDDILSTFGQDAPKTPQLRLRNVTQTSVTLEWDRLYLATAKLLSLDIYRNNQRLPPIPSPLHNTSTKLSGLDVNAEYTFHLVLRTTAGTFPSPLLRVRTHDIADTSGIAVCFGFLFPGSASGSGNDRELEDAAREALRRMGAREPTERIQIETTHFVCSDPRDRGAIGGGQGPMYTKAMQLNIPVVQPHWIFACYEQKRMVPISAYYLENDPPNAATIRETIHRILSKDGQPAAGAGAAAATAAASLSNKEAPATPRGPSTDIPRALAGPEATGPGQEDSISHTIEATRVVGDDSTASQDVSIGEEQGQASAAAAETVAGTEPSSIIAGVPVITSSEALADEQELDSRHEPPTEEEEAEPVSPMIRSIPSITVIAPASEEGDLEDHQQEDISSEESGMEDISLGGNTPSQERSGILEDEVTAAGGGQQGSGPQQQGGDEAEEEVDLR